MKQTNNAIKFLMAQYRAIFQNAYFKGLATAAVVTMGLAAGQAQAMGKTEFVALAQNTDITSSDALNITEKAENTNEITLTIKSGNAHKFTAGASTASSATLIINGEGEASATKLTIKGDSAAATSLDVKNFELQNGTLDLAKHDSAAQGGTLTADQITIGKAPNSTEPSFLATPNTPTAVVTVGANSTLGEATSVYQLYEGAQITVAEGGTLTGASLKAAGGKIIYNDNADFALKSYNEKDDAAQQLAQDLDIEVAATKKLSVKLAGTAKDNRGVLHFGNGSVIDLKSDSATGGALEITADSQKSGSIVIFDQGVKLTSSTGGTAGGTLSIKGTDSGSLAELRTDADVLGNFLVAGTGENEDVAGGVLVDEHAKLTINNKKVELGAANTENTNEALKLKVLSGTAAAAGQLTIKAATTLEADNVAIVNKLDDGTKLADKLSIVADKLTLGAADFDSNTNKFGFQSASAKSELNFVSKTGGNTLKLQDTVTLHNVDSDNKALAGKITGDVNLASTLTIKGGNYTYNDNITIGSSASNKLEVKTEAGVDKASLVLGGSLLVDRANASQVTASGTDSGEAFIDLSNATITFEPKATTTAAITFLADKNATIKVGGESLQELVKDPNAKGAIFSVANGGTLLVGGDLTLADASTQLKNTGVTNSGIQLANGTVAIDGTLTLKKADSVSLGASDATTTKLKAQVLSLEDKTPDTATELKSGTFAVTQTLNTNSNKGFTLGEQGVLELGALTTVTPKTGDAYYEAVGGGSVNQALEVSGTVSAVKVLTGNWNGTDLTIKQASGLVVGQQDAKDSKGKLISANLTVNKLDVQADSGSTINKGSSLTTTEVALSTGTVVVDGDLSINGKYTAEDTKAGTPASYGLAFKDNSVVLNEGASLTLGADVNYALGIAPDATKIDAITPVDTIFLDAGVVSGGAFSNVSITLGEGVSLTTEAITQLEKALFGTDGTSGTISIGQATIADLPYDKTASTEDTPVLNWKDVKNDSGLMAVLPKVEDEKLKSALIKADQNDTLLGNIGSIQTNGFTGSKVNIGGNGSLNSADVVKGQANKLFAYNDKGEVLGLDIKEGVNFKLVNGGEAGDVSLGANSQLMIDGGASNGKTVLASLSGKTSEKVIVAGDLDVKGKLELNNVESKAGTTLNVAKDTTFAGISTLAGDTVVAGKLTTEKAFTSTGNLSVTGKATFNEKAVLSGAQNNLGVVEFKAADNQIAQGQTFASNVQLSANTSSLVVGTEETTENNKGASATLITDTLSLNGGKLYIDPSYEVESSFVVADALKNADLEHNIAGTLDGTAVVLKNSVLALGVNNDEDGALDSVKAELAPLFNANGALDSKNGLKVGAVAYAAKSITLGDTDKLVVDANKTLTQHKDATATTYQTNINNSSLYLGANSALAVDGAAFGEGKAAIQFSKQNAQIYADQGAVVLVTGKDALNAKGNKLFDGTGLTLTNGAGVATPSLTVQTINGWFSQKLDSTNLTANLKLDPDKAVIDADLTVVSAPVKDTLLSAVYEKHNYEEYLADQSVDPDYVLGNVSAAVTFDGSKYMYNGAEITKAQAEQKYNIDVEKTEALAQKNPDNIVVYEYASNALLENILTGNKGNAIDAETNARLAVFGGAPQAAIEAGASTYEAISARMGVGVSGVSAAANGQGGAIWVTPVYKSAESDGFNADNKSYGADVKLYGLALGADIEVAPNFKVGGMFNVGSGDADGQGLGANVSNDFDYYGLGLYAGYSMDALSLVADVTYTAVDNDIEGNTDLGKVTTSIDSTNLSVGVTGQYKLSVAGMDVTPHAGLRYSMIDMDDYSTAYSQNDSDSLNIFSVPVGVTIAKEYVTDTWTVKPSFDLTLTGNFGDDEAEATAKWNGFSNLSTTVKSEIMDNFTYGAAVGVSATSGNFGLGLGLNYTGSSNTDEFGVNANARYMF